MDHPATQAAARALEATFGPAPVYIREGGSIPVCASFESILGLPVVLLGFTPPDENAHAPNEWMDLRNYETGIRTIARTVGRAGRPAALSLRRRCLCGFGRSGWVIRRRFGCYPRATSAIPGGTHRVSTDAPDHDRCRDARGTWRHSTPTTAACGRVRRSTSWSTSTTRSRPAGLASTSRSRSASRRSTRRSAPACAPASCCSSAAPRAPARRRWPSRWRATSRPAARPTSCTSASSTTSSTCSTG